MLTTKISEESDLIFSPWGIRRSSVDRIRLYTIPVKELIEITKDECEKNSFTVNEAKDILKSTINSLKEFIETEKDLEIIAGQEYANQGILKGTMEWYEEIF